MVGDRGDIQMGGELFVSRVLELRRESMRGRGGSASTSPEETTYWEKLGGKVGGRNNFLASTSSRYNGMTTTTSSIRVNSIMSQIGERRANVSVDAKSQSVTAMVRCIAIFYASPSNHDS